MERALLLLDEIETSVEVSAYLDLAANRLREAFSFGGDGSDNQTGRIGT
jgi:hypothetical protein